MVCKAGAPDQAGVGILGTTVGNLVGAGTSVAGYGLERRQWRSYRSEELWSLWPK